MNEPIHADYAACAPVRCSTRRTATRRGQALAEFAVIAVLLYLLIGGILTFGYALFIAQGLQQAADLAAREISRTPLPLSMKLDKVDGNDDDPGGALYGNANSIDALIDVRRQVFDKHYLVLRIPVADSLADVVANLPVVNQQLFPLMISDVIDDGAGGMRVIRYPGRVVQDTDPSDDPAAVTLPSGDSLASSGYLVEIPLMSGGQVPVIEEIESVDDPNPFQLSSPHGGLVSLRINYPWHSPFMFGVDSGNAAVAAEAGAGASLGPLGNGYGPYVGEQGFGKQAADVGTGTTGIRPFRKLISAQAIYRREIFTP